MYIKGHGKIGRLGFGNESTQFNLKTLKINNCQIKDFSVGYNHTLYWGISRGKLTLECKLFLKKEKLKLDWKNK